MSQMETTEEATAEPNMRRGFLRDAIVFQGKLALDGLRDLILMPVALVASGIDLVKREETPGRRFYDVVDWGRQTERWIDLFEAADRAPETDRARPRIDAPSLDELADQLERKLRAEHTRGNPSASAKDAVDRIVDAAKRLKTSFAAEG